MNTWTCVDKRAWGAGPWADEPDGARWRDSVTGLPCLALRSESGVWCAYVGIPPGHPFHGQSPLEDAGPITDLDVHGGLNFGESCSLSPSGESQCAWIHAYAPDTHWWWLGFDCGHLRDSAPPICPEVAALEAELAHLTADIPGLRRYYRTWTYVQAECATLAAQLARPGGGEPSAGGALG